MSNLLKIGRVVSVDTLTTGTLDVAGIGIVDYNDPLLTDKEVLLSVGDTVCGCYIGFEINDLAPLDALYADSLVQLNALNPLDSTKIRNSILSAKCCAVNKASLGITESEEECCQEDEDSIRQMLNMANGISCIVPEGEIISGKQAIYEFRVLSVTHTSVGKVFAIAISDPSSALVVTYSLTSTSATEAGVASDMADYINSFYPQNYSYQAKSYDRDLVIYGNSFDDDNGYLVAPSITNGTLTVFTPAVFIGGTTPVLQGENAITNNDIQIVLNKMCELCKN